MATEIIFIKKQTNGTGLHLSDNQGHAGDNTITTNVRKGDTVHWKLAHNSGISELTNIYKKEGSQNIFSTLPTKQADGSFKGIVSDDATGSEAYNIGYKIGDTEYICDPLLEVQPPPSPPING